MMKTHSPAEILAALTAMVALEPDHTVIVLTGRKTVSGRTLYAEYRIRTGKEPSRLSVTAYWAGLDSHSELVWLPQVSTYTD